MDSRRPITPSYFLIPRDSRPLGYAALVRRHALATLPHHRWSFLAAQGTAKVLDQGRFVLRLPYLDPDEMSDVDRVLFSLKHDGLSLPILCELFTRLPRAPLERELVAAIRAAPTGQYPRRLWFLYEWLTSRRLALGDAGQMNYIPVLDVDEYFVGRSTRSPRHRVIDNLPGTVAFCPIVRRSTELAKRSPDALRQRIETLVAGFDPDLLSRALAFLCTKETRSSFEIERETPTASRAERFASLLGRVTKIGELSEETLTGVQNRIVEERYAEPGYRTDQNYIGESHGLHRQIVHYVPPKPGAVGALMVGLIQAFVDHRDHVADAVVLAATIAFGFVFIHPFDDGNGRLHRFLVHYVLERGGITSPGVIVPVSAVMLARRAEYDAVLEGFSNPLLEIVAYDLDHEDRMTVVGDTARHYRYFDATAAAEALYRWLDQAIDGELRDELKFLLGLRGAKQAMREIIDLPDRKADLFIKLVAGNKGHLARRKREQFAELTDTEIADLEAAVREHLL